MHNRRRRSINAGALLAAASVVLLSTGALSAVAAVETGIGQCLPEQPIAEGISLTCLVQPASTDPTPNEPSADTRIHWSTIDLTTAGVAPVVVQSNDTIFQPVGATPSPTGSPEVNETVTSMANRSTGVVVGVNGGYFDNDKGPERSGYTATYTGVPCGGVMTAGRILRSPPNDPQLNASVYARADGTIGIGQVSFTGELQVLGGDGEPAVTAPLDSINNLGDAFSQPGCPRALIKTETAGDGITMVTPDMGYVELMAGNEVESDPGYAVPATTEVVQVTASATGAAPDEYVVESTVPTQGLTSIEAIPEGRVTLLASTTENGDGQGAFLATLQQGQLLRISTQLAVGTGDDALAEGAQIVSLVGGVAQLVSDGTLLSDPVGYTPRGSNAETLVGVNGTGSEATLIVIDKDTVSPGVTWQQAGQAAVDRGVTDALLLDGGGSSTLVAQLPTPAVEPSGQDSRVTVVNTPANDANFPEGVFTQRLVGNGLFFTGTIASPAPTPVPTSASGPQLAPTGSTPGIAIGVAGTCLVLGAGLLLVWRQRRTR